MLAQVSISPIVTVPAGLDGTCRQVYVVLWMCTFLLNLVSVFAAVILLGYLLQTPKKGCEWWLADLGMWADFPTYSTIVGLVMCIASASYTGWVLCTPCGSRISASSVVIIAGGGVTILVCVLLYLLLRRLGSVRFAIPVELT